MEKGFIFDFFDDVNQSSSSSSPENRSKLEPPEPEENIIPNERTAFLLFPFFVQLIDQFKETLKNLEAEMRISQQKFRDPEWGASLHGMIAEDVKKIDLLQNNLLNYIKINNPIIKANTVNTLLEEELKKYQIELEEKKVKIFKSLEKNLPETAIPDDQLRYITSCVLQYVITVVPYSESLGLFTKSMVLQRKEANAQGSAQKERTYVEILMVYTGRQIQADPFEPAIGTSVRKKDGILNLTLNLVDEIVKRNRGVMKIQEDEKKQKTIVSLTFPAERRKVVYYRSADELSSSLRRSRTTFEELSSLVKKRS